MNPHDSTEAWWTVFHRATALRGRLREAQRKREKDERSLEHEEKRAVLEEIRRETFALLTETHIPQPLKMLVLDLLGPHLAADGWATTKDVEDPLPSAKAALARIEAEQPGEIGNRKLATLLHKQTGKNIDKTQIRRWRQDPNYQYLLWRFRQDEGGH